MSKVTESAFPLPSKELMWNVAMTHDPEEFRKVGKRCATELSEASALAGVPMLTASRVLDWGCGPCRTLRWLLAEANPGQYYGCDVDRRAIDWCKKNAKKASFAVTGAKPPLPYPDEFFDVVFGVSVVTHLSAEFQGVWLRELRRIVRPGGVLMLSVMGPAIAAGLPEPRRSEFFKNGFLFVHSDVWTGIHAEWYADAYQSEAQVRRAFGEYFNVLAYKPGGMNGHQDLVVMQRPAA